jgi:flagellar hook-basal body complex protein FliE
MPVTFTGANAAYQAAARIAEAASGTQAASGAQAAGSPAQGFGNFLKDAMESMRAGEAAAAQGGAGKGELVQIVNKVTEAELTLETVVAIRDRVISAYQDIMRMPI